MNMRRIVVAATIAAAAGCLAPTVASAQIIATGTHDQAVLGVHDQANIVGTHDQAYLGVHDQAAVNGTHNQAVMGAHDQISAIAIASTSDRDVPNPVLDGLVVALVVGVGGAAAMRRRPHAAR